MEVMNLNHFFWLGPLMTMKNVFLSEADHSRSSMIQAKLLARDVFGVVEEIAGVVPTCGGV